MMLKREMEKYFYNPEELFLLGLTDDPIYQADFNSSGCAVGTNAERSKAKCWSFVGSPPFEDYTYEDHVSRDAYFGAALL